MSLTGPSPLDALTTEHATRMRGIDELIEEASVPDPGPGTLLKVDGAAGVATTIDIDPGSLGATWNELRRHVLGQIRVGGPDPAASMRRLLAAWRETIAEVPVPGHGESPAVVGWASRDAAVVQALRHGGFGPTAVLAARTGGGDRLPAARADFVVRPIEPRDLERVTEMHVALAAWDAHFGGAHSRPSTPMRMRGLVTELIAAPRTRAWVAEADGELVGTVDVEWPESNGWAVGSLAADPATVGYIGGMIVVPGRRGAGVGSALVAAAHDEFAAHDVRLPVLHYAPLNPLSAPFWHRMGYRPVRTTWKALPHTALRVG